MYKRLLIFLIFSFLILSSSFAQQAREAFGRNRIQYKAFDWKYYSSDNFDVYFYDNNADMAKQAVTYLESEFDRITDLIGYPPYNKTKIFLYGSVSDLQQSNVGVNDISHSVGGQTKFVKSYIEVANPGSTSALKEELLLRITQLLVDDMMFGGSLTEVFQSAYLLNLPEWFIGGVSEYIAKGWNEEMDDYIRELVHTKKVKKISKFTGEEARLIGHSIWNFIAHKYGRSNISNILNYTRIIRNEEKSIAVTLGMSFKQLIYEWENFYLDLDNEIAANYQEVDEEKEFYGRNRKRTIFNNIKISPDGTKLAYTVNDNGRYQVYIKNLESGKEDKVISGGYKVINQKINEDIPLLSWADDKTLGIINVKKGQNVFWLYDLESKSKLPRPMTRFGQVKSFSFSGNGRLAVLSANVDGQNDIFLMSTKRDRVRQLTNDIYDDLNPSFVPNTNVIVFSSNRKTDALKNLEKEAYEKLSNNFNIFMFSLDTTKNTLLRITNTISKDFHPVAESQFEVYYLSDQKGITNLFKYDLSNGIYNQVTNYKLSIRTYDLNFTTGKMAYVMMDRQSEQIYLDDAFNFDNNIFTPPNKRYELKQAKLLVERRAANEKLRKQNKNTETKEDATQLSNEIQEDTLKIDNVAIENETGLIDTDNYVFDKEVAKEKEKEKENKDKGSFLSQYRSLRKKNNVTGPFPYQTRFSADNLITSWVIDPLRGFGILLETEMNDMLEDHRFYGGLMTTTDLRNGDVFAEYQYLGNLIDYNFRYDREVIFQESTISGQRYTSNRIELGASYPLSIKSRFTFKPFYTNVKYENVESSGLASGGISPLFDPIEEDEYVGVKMELVFDNSIEKGVNHIEGTKGKFTFEHHEVMNRSGLSFSNISLDLRHYQKIHKELIFATRFYYGKFFGDSPKKYLLGGMDNWLFNDENEDGDGNPLREISATDTITNNRDLPFVEYATSLRGFDYAVLFGTDVMLFNAEFRIPIIRYFHGGPISSNFFRNLQLIGFYDIGSSWTGVSPFSEDNTVNTDSRVEGAFEYTIRSFQNPWLSSYGVGLRTVILGYYMKFDLAWPIEDYEVQSPRLFVTLGYDF